MPVDVKVETEGNPEFKKILVTGTTSGFDIETFGRPKPNGITIDPNNNLLKSSPRLRVRATIARGEALATLGKYYEAIQQYQQALWMSSRPIRSRTSGWARRCSIRKIIKRPPTLFAQRWAAI